MNSKLFSLICLPLLLFSSCTNLFHIDKRKYRPGFYTKDFTANKKTKVLNTTFFFTNAAFIPEENRTDTVPQAGDSTKVLSISSVIGDIIDSAEKAKYDLFPFWFSDEFSSAQFIQQPDSSIILVGRMKNGTIQKKNYTKAAYGELVRNNFGVNHPDRVISISPVVGDTIDPVELRKYHLFHSLNNNEFVSGQFIQKSNNSIVFVAKLENGTTKNIRVKQTRYTEMSANYFNGNNDYYNSCMACKNATLAIILITFWFLLIPVIFAIICSIKAYKYGKLVTDHHPDEAKYPAKNKARYGVIIGTIGYALMGLAVTILLALLLAYLRRLF
jgi:hypothetical protein